MGGLPGIRPFAGPLWAVHRKPQMFQRHTRAILLTLHRSLKKRFLHPSTHTTSPQHFLYLALSIHHPYSSQLLLSPPVHLTTLSHFPIVDTTLNSHKATPPSPATIVLEGVPESQAVCHRQFHPRPRSSSGTRSGCRDVER